MGIDHKVILSDGNESVVFEASAPLSESRTANWGGFSIVQLPTSLYSYQHTSSRGFGISGKFVSRTPEEARLNSAYLNLIRKWVLPEFGKSGATPPVLKLSAYNNTNINNLQVLLMSYEFPFPEEVDYIWNKENAMPIITSINLRVEEVYSPEQITAGKWKIKQHSRTTGPQARSKVRNDNSINISNNSLDNEFPTEKSRSAGNALSVSNNGIASTVIGRRTITIPGLISGNIVRNIGRNILSSPNIRQITRSLPPVLGNIFVAGSNILIDTVSSSVRTGVSAIKTSPNGFNKPTEKIIKSSFSDGD